MPISDELKEKLKAAHPDRELHFLANEFAELVVAVPTQEEYQRWVDESQDAAVKTRADRVLLTGAVVHPPEAEFQALLRKRPGIVRVFASEIVELAGVKAVTERKKL